MSKSSKAATPKVSNVSQMRTYYQAKVLPFIGTKANKDLRRSFIDQAINKLGTTDAAGASMFNVIQKENIAANTVQATAVGRGAQAVAKAEAEAADTGPDMSLNWARINKATRAVVETYPTRAAALSGKGDDETAVKTASL